MKERVIKMYFSGDLKFDTDEQAHEFYHALGRMVAYGINGTLPGLSAVSIGIDTRQEITGAYYPQRHRVEGSYGDNKPFYALDDTLDHFMGKSKELGHVFVMGAVPRPETPNTKFHYSFHT
ncbi:MAG: hypothetical protein CTY35_03480 [Methylotenera sp.]|nr:MAG: hypothetical protein CTY35_03480 [Methylotenera sp.]